MNRHYIDELGIKFEETPQGWNQNDSRQEYWKKEREKYGFDERDTWYLHYTIDLLLYERLCNFKENAKGCIDLTFHKFKYKDEILTQEECIDRMIEGLKLELTLDEFDEKRKCKKVQKLIDDVYPIYAICKYSLWW